VLSGSDRLLPDVPGKEAIEIAFFSDPTTLRTIAGDGVPSGAVIFNALWSILRSGFLPERITGTKPCYRFEMSSDRRTGTLVIEKDIGGKQHAFHMEWQIKGAQFDAATNTSRAHFVLTIFDRKESSRAHHARQLLAGIAMPVLKHVHATLPYANGAFSKMRLIIIHHRTHEVARTLQAVQELGLRSTPS
jgi:hypothetical protein